MGTKAERENHNDNIEWRLVATVMIVDIQVVVVVVVAVEAVAF